MGWTMPVGVRKLRSTTTGVDVGLRSETYSASEPAVEPPAKYHRADVVVWQGAWDQPRELPTVWVAATPPPDVMTVSDSQEPDETAGMGGTATPLAGTTTAACPVAPESVTAVMVAVTGRAVVLVSTSEPGDTPPAVDWPVQYQADDSVSGALTRAAGASAGPPGIAGAARTQALPSPRRRSLVQPRRSPRSRHW